MRKCQEEIYDLSPQVSRNKKVNSILTLLGGFCHFQKAIARIIKSRPHGFFWRLTSPQKTEN